jgi:hypothetical protein
MTTPLSDTRIEKACDDRRPRDQQNLQRKFFSAICQSSKKPAVTLSNELRAGYTRSAKSKPPMHQPAQTQTQASIPSGSFQSAWRIFFQWGPSPLRD